MTDVLSKAIHKQMSENIVEIFGFLQTVKHPLHNELLTLLNKEEDIQNLEILIVKITQAFSSCAFLLENDLEVLRPAIQSILDKNILFKEFLSIYEQAVDLNDINENLTNSEYKYAKKRLDDFLYSF